MQKYLQLCTTKSYNDAFNYVTYLEADLRRVESFLICTWLLHKEREHHPTTFFLLIGITPNKWIIILTQKSNKDTTKNGLQTCKLCPFSRGEQCFYEKYCHQLEKNQESLVWMHSTCWKDQSRQEMTKMWALWHIINTTWVEIMKDNSQSVFKGQQISITKLDIMYPKKPPRSRI